MKNNISNTVIWCLVLLAVTPLWAVSSEPNASPVFKPEEPDQFPVPIVLYPDLLISKVLMVSTYPIEVVWPDRWASQNTEQQAKPMALFDLNKTSMNAQYSKNLR